MNSQLKALVTELEDAKSCRATMQLLVATSKPNTMMQSSEIRALLQAILREKMKVNPDQMQVLQE